MTILNGVNKRMVRSNNKGFSLIEVIIAAAVFAILIYPITTALISSTKTGTKSTKKQYAVEKAEEIMENFKTADIAKDVYLPDSNGTTAYKLSKGSSVEGELTLPDSTKAKYHTTSFSCNDISIGKNYEKYNCTVEVSDAAYQAMKKGYVLTDSKDGGTYKLDSKGAVLDTGITESGTIRNLDSKQSAIIAGATYNTTAEQNNIDNLAYKYFKDVKASLLKEFKVLDSQYMSGNNIFKDDKFSKNTLIKITKLGDEYTVKCIVEYTDHTDVAQIQSKYEASGSNVYKPTTSFPEDGVVFEQKFTVKDGEKLPPIYLLYVPAICGDSYTATDTITIDNSTVRDTGINVYVFENTDKLSSTYKKVIKEQFKKDVSDLVYSNAESNINIKDVKVRLKLADGAASAKLNVYSNFDFDNTNSDYPVKRTTEDESENVYMYDIKVTLTDSEGNKTVVTGTRGR